MPALPALTCAYYSFNTTHRLQGVPGDVPGTSSLGSGVWPRYVSTPLVSDEHKEGWP